MSDNSYKSIESQLIDFVRFPLAIMVVIHHCFGNSIMIPYDNILDLGVYDEFRCAISHVLVHIDNPTFFFISGYLFFIGGQRLDWHNYSSKILNRVRSLLVPYISWNILTLIAGACMYFVSHREIITYLSNNCNFHIFWDAISQEVVDYGPLNLSYTAFTPLNGPLWFLRDLMVVTLISPLLYSLIKWSREIFIALLAILFFTNIWYPIGGISPCSIFFFSIGAYFGIFNKSFVAFINKYSILICSLTILTFIPTLYYDGMNTETGLYIYPTFVTLNTFTFLFVCSKVLSHTRLVSASMVMKKHVFFIYGSHVGLYIVAITGVCFSKVISDGSADALLILRYIGIIVSVSCVCILLSFIMTKMMPKTYKYITGSR